MTSSPPATLSSNRNRSFGTETTIMSCDNDQTDAKPLLSQGSSVSSGSFNQMQRRRVSGKLGKPGRQQSFSRDIGHAAAETYLLTRLTITLLRYLG
jgi:prenylcysteine alpha-carboxyl methylesterase